ncbi:auxilin-related protein 2-like, partial [Trifolium medium]|nr:auxilin-related protein 2-like [Trifolium medium]
MASTKRSSPKTTSVSPQNGSRSPQHSPFDFDYGVFATANNKTQTTSGDFSDGIDQIFGAGIPKS